jgi:Peptidase family M48
MDDPSGGAGADAAQGRPKIELRKPSRRGPDGAPISPVPAGPSIKNPPVPLIGTPLPPLPPMSPNRLDGPQPMVTVPMAPHQIALVQIASTPGAVTGGVAPTVRDPVPALPLPVVPPPRASSRRRSGGPWPVVAVVMMLVAGAAIAVLWSKQPRDDAESKPIPLPPPPTVLKPEPNPLARPSGVTVPPPVPTAPSGPPRPPRESGWIPADAVQATDTADLHADPQGDPLCRDTESLVQIGKSVAVSLEREMREATKMSDEEESRIGKRLESALAKHRSFAGKWDLPADVRKYGGYLSDLVQHITKGKARAGIKYRVHVVRRPEFNAAALPGGVLMVYTGAFEGEQAFQDEAELVTILGHEIAHVEKRHTIAAYQYAKALLGEVEDAQIAIKILSTPIASEYELEADEHGLELALKAQYNPQAAVNLWRRHAKSERSVSGGALGELLSGLLRSHPRAPVRGCRAMKQVLWARDNAPWIRLYDGQTNLKTHVIGPKHPY